jgi:alpha-pyrone synthase
MRETFLQAIGTAVPRYSASQAFAAEFNKRVAQAYRTGAFNGGDGEGDRRAPSPGVIDRIFKQSAIESRSSVLADYLREPHEFDFYPKNWALYPSPSTSARMELYRREAPPLAREAAEACLAAAPGVPRQAVTHLVVVTCTGFFAPGIDIVLARALGLRPDVQRQIIGFMGCYGAFNGLRAAAAACTADPDAVALVVCVELCTIHFQQDLTMDNIVANCLFSDGAAAALVTGAGRPAGPLALVDSYTIVEEDSLDQMTWTVVDTGFRMTLGAEVPDTLRRSAGPFVETLLGRNQLTLDDVAFWAIHPGGRRIVEAVRETLGLSADDVAPSFEVLARHGNMSSPTVLFVLERCLARRPEPGAIGVAMAFGPGLTVESLLVRAR